jgi:hypothetical protein
VLHQDLLADKNPVTLFLASTSFVDATLTPSRIRAYSLLNPYELF